MARLVLIIPTSTYRASDFVAAAAALSAEVVVASERRPAMARTMGENALLIDVGDAAGAAAVIVEAAGRTPVDAVVGVDDQGVLIAALASEALGLPHNPPASVAAAKDKLRMRAALATGSVLQPGFAAARSDDEVLAAGARVGWPCVVKPTSMAASRGVIRADDPEALLAAAHRVRAILKDARDEGPLLIESFVEGSEFAVEGLLRAGSLEVLAIFDKPDPLDGPFFEETIYVTPSRHPAATLEEAERATAAATKALGLTEGPIHAEIRVNSEGGWVVEVAARSIGGLCSRALRFGAGISLEEVILRHALGLPVDDLRSAGTASGVMMMPIAKRGRLVRVEGIDDARAVSGVEGVELTIGPGRPVVPLPEADRYLGFIFATGDEPASVEAALRRAHSSLNVVIGEDP